MTQLVSANFAFPARNDNASLARLQQLASDLELAESALHRANRAAADLPDWIRLGLARYPAAASAVSMGTGGAAFHPMSKADVDAEVVASLLRARSGLAAEARRTPGITWPASDWYEALGRLANSQSLLDALRSRDGALIAASLEPGGAWELLQRFEPISRTNPAMRRLTPLLFRHADAAFLFRRAMLRVWPPAGGGTAKELPATDHDIGRLEQALRSLASYPATLTVGEVLADLIERVEFSTPGVDVLLGDIRSTVRGLEEYDRFIREIQPILAQFPTPPAGAAALADRFDSARTSAATESLARALARSRTSALDAMVKPANLRRAQALQAFNEQLASLGGRDAFAINLGQSLALPSAPTRALRLGRTAFPVGEAVSIDRAVAPPVPFEIPLHEARSFVVEAPATAMALDFVHDLAMKLALGSPAGDVRLTVIDLFGRSVHFAPLLRLVRESPALYPDATRGSVLTDAQSSEQALRALLHEAQNRLIYQLGDRTAADEPARPGARSEPRHIVVLAGLQPNLGPETRAAVELLCDPARGGRAGFVTFVVHDPSVPVKDNHAALLNSLHALCATVRVASATDAVVDRAGQSTPFEPDDPRFWESQAAAQIPAQYQEQCKRRATSGQDFAGLLSSERDATGDASRSSANGLRIPIGFDGRGRVVALELGSGASHHALMVGKTGSGKSRFLQTLALASAELYSPDELELALIDCKEGVGFAEFADKQLPHARTVALGSDREFVVSVLKHYEELMRDRNRRFTEERCADIAGLRSKTGERMPRVLLIIDEFQHIFAQEDQIKRSGEAAINAIVRQGRSAGVHLLLSSQSMKGDSNLSQEIVSQMAARILLMCEEQDSDRLLGSPRAARSLTAVRQGLMNLQGGGGEQNDLSFTTARIDEAILRERLSHILAHDGGWRRPICFDGQAAPEMPSEAELCRSARDAQGDHIVLGLALELGEDPRLSRPWVSERGCNLLGLSPRRGAEADAVLETALRATGGWTSPPRLLMPAPSPRDSESLHRMGRWIVGRGGSLVPAQGFEAVLLELDAERKHREQSGAEGRVLLILPRLDSMTQLKDSYPPTPMAEAFSRILADGAVVGIHVLALVTSYPAIRELPRGAERAFGIRFAPQLGDQDSQSMFTTIAATRLRPNRCLLSDFTEPASTWTFVPYTQPASRAGSQTTNGALAEP